MFYRANITLKLSSDTVEQGKSISFNISMFNVFRDAINDSVVQLYLYSGGELIRSATFTALKNGLYTYNLDITNMRIGVYRAEIFIENKYYGTFVMVREIYVYGEINLNIKSPNVVEKGEISSIIVFISDSYDFPIMDAGVNITISDMTFKPNVTSMGRYFFYISTKKLHIGKVLIEIEASHKYAKGDKVVTSSFDIISEPLLELSYINVNQSVIQGQTIEIKGNLKDIAGEPIQGADIIAYFLGKGYTFTDLGNGTYVVSIPTNNVPGGNYTLTFRIEHQYLKSKVVTDSIVIYNEIQIDVTIEPEKIIQNSEFVVYVTVWDKFHNPIKNASVYLLFGDDSYSLHKKNDSNTYYAIVSTYGLKYGEYVLWFRILENFSLYFEYSVKTFVYPELPSISIDTPTFMKLLGISFIFSLIGLFLYYYIGMKIQKRFSVDEKGMLTVDLSPLTKLFIILSSIYIIFLLTALAIGLRAMTLSISLLLADLLLTLLLIGIWLFTTSADILIKEKMSIKRILSGIWLYATFIIIMISLFALGRNIDWFDFYIASDVIEFRGIAISKLLLTMIGTFISSVIALSFNIFRNAQNITGRFKQMRADGTPEKVINDEKIIQMDRMANSIKIKFLVFLAVIGVSAVSAIRPLLVYYPIAILVILPLLLLIIVPYITSTLLKLIRKRKTETTM